MGLRIGTGDAPGKEGGALEPDPGHGGDGIPRQPHRRRPAAGRLPGDRPGPPGQAVSAPGRGSTVSPTGSASRRRPGTGSPSPRATSSTPAGPPRRPKAGGNIGAIDEIVHCASSTAFAERKRAEVEATNVDGLENVLDYAARIGCGFFHHVSTAYVAGSRTGACPEDWVEEGPFTNVYEETKARGEILARDVCRARRDPAQRLQADHRVRRFPDGPDIALQRALLPRQGGRLSPGYLPGRHPRTRRPEGRRAGRPDRGRRRAVHAHPDRGRRARAASTSSRSTTVSRPSWPSSRTASTAASITSSTPGRRGSRTSSPSAGVVSAWTASKRAGRRPSRRGRRTPWRSSTIPTSRSTGRTCRTRGPSRTATRRRILEKRGLVCPEFDYEVFARCMEYAVEMDWGVEALCRDDGAGFGYNRPHGDRPRLGLAPAPGAHGPGRAGVPRLPDRRRRILDPGKGPARVRHRRRGAQGQDRGRDVPGSHRHRRGHGRRPGNAHPGQARRPGGSARDHAPGALGPAAPGHHRAGLLPEGRGPPPHGLRPDLRHLPRALRRR